MGQIFNILHVQSIKKPKLIFGMWINDIDLSTKDRINCSSNYSSQSKNQKINKKDFLLMSKCCSENPNGISIKVSFLCKRFSKLFHNIDQLICNISEVDNNFSDSVLEGLLYFILPLFSLKYDYFRF